MIGYTVYLLTYHCYWYNIVHKPSAQSRQLIVVSYLAKPSHHHNIELLAIREQRKALIDRGAKTTGGGAFGAQILMEIGTTAAATVFEVHRSLLSAERSGPVADLLDVSQRFLRLFALCKVSGDVAKEVSKTGIDDTNNIMITS